MSDLKALIEAVEAGVFPGDVTAKDLGVPEANIAILTFYEAFSGSMDAAIALFEELLPGWFPGVSQNIHHGHWFAWVQDFATSHHSAIGPDPARALLLATLKAVEAGNG